MVAKQLVVAVFLLGATWAQRNGTDDRAELPRDMVDQCIRNGGKEAYNNVERAIKQLRTCNYNFADWDKLAKDIEEAKRVNRSVNEVFKKYCSGRSQFFERFSEVTESLKSCFKAGERARGNLDVVRNVVDQLVEFICEDDGAVIISLAADGEGCWKQDTWEALEKCSDGLVPIFPERSNNTMNNLLDIEYNDSTCRLLYEYQKCLVQNLKTCSQAAGDTAQLLIRNMLLSTPCKDKHKHNSASGLSVTILSSVMSVSCLLLV